MNFREIIRRELEAQGVSQSELARRADMLPHRVCDYLAERRDLSGTTLERVFAALKLDIRRRRRGKGR